MHKLESFVIAIFCHLINSPPTKIVLDINLTFDINFNKKKVSTRDRYFLFLTSVVR